MKQIANEPLINLNDYGQSVEWTEGEQREKKRPSQKQKKKKKGRIRTK